MLDGLKQTITRAIQQACENEVNDATRAKLMDRYMGEPYGDEVEGLSKFVSSDVSDVVEAILPDIMDVFTSSEDIVAFEPVGQEDEEAAKQETDVVSHIFWKENNGFLTLYTWIKEALIQQNSYVKSGWVEKERVSVEEYEDLTPEELAQILQQLDGEYEILEQEGFEVSDAGFQQTGPIRVKIRCVKREKRYEVNCIPQEEFFASPRWNSVSLDGIACCGHKQEIELGELRRMGFSEASIEKAHAERDIDDDQDLARHDTNDHFSEYDDEDGDNSTRKVTVYEAYVRADWDDDGRAELLKVWAIGDGSEILEWEDGGEAIEEVSHHPFSCITPYVVPHRHVGRSIAELVDDIQHVKTVLIRQTLDNVYGTNHSRPMFDETQAGPDTFDDLMNPVPGAAVRTGGAIIEWAAPQPVHLTTLPLLDTFDNLKETRTGATRYNQGLDAESLNKTATGIKEIMDASRKKTKLVARTFAETGIRDLFLRIHRDLRSGPHRELAIKLRNQWVAINPRTWKDRTDLSVKVGEGSGDRMQRREALMLVGNLQRELMAAQMPFVNPQHIYNTAEKMMETYGFEGIEPFMDRPEDIPPPPEEPDPNEQAMQFEMQMRQQELQIKAQEQQEKWQLEREKVQLQHAREMEKIRLQMAAEQRTENKTAADILEGQERVALDRQRAVMDDDFKRDKLEIDAMTGFHRQNPQPAQSQPPMDYRKVSNDAQGNS